MVLETNITRGHHLVSGLPAHNGPHLSLSQDFVNKELVLWAKYDVERAIPSVIDGLKPGQRKVLFSAFLKRLTQALGSKLMVLP